MIKKFFKKIHGSCFCFRHRIKSGSNIFLGKNVKVYKGKNIKFGSNVTIRSYCALFASNPIIFGNNVDLGERSRIAGRVVVGDSVLFGPNVFVCRYDHQYRDINIPIINQDEYEPSRNGHEELSIGAGSWIGTNCVIIGDVHIGEHCVIGANSVVVKDIPDYSVAVGCPAIIIKRFNKETNKWEPCFDERI